MGEPLVDKPSPACLAPDVGTLFEYDGAEYRCTGWLRPAEPPMSGQGWAKVISELLYESAYQRDGVRFQWCLREEATHVSGSGVCGCLAEITRIRVTGQVEQPADVLESERAIARALGREGRIVS
ncbi:hypothetical protein AB7872_08910 [Rhodanobacter denitrificans]|uniref:hypothetical protein n=2 Tax=Rhodanobacter TaxID=75309 RepID=UPI00128FD52C|nr:hypothetical protein [Rhodanobacter sp. FW510-R10]